MVNGMIDSTSQKKLPIATWTIWLEDRKVELHSDLSLDEEMADYFNSRQTIEQFLGLSHALEHQYIIDAIDSCCRHKSHMDLIFLSSIKNQEGFFIKMQGRYDEKEKTSPCIAGKMYIVPLSMISAAFLQEKYLFLRALLENMDEGVVACDADGVLTLFNRMTRVFHGLGSAVIPADQWSNYYSLYSADGKNKLKHSDVPIIRVLNGEIINNVEMLIAPKGCQKKIVSCSGRQIINANQEVLGAVVTMHDITEQKNNQRELARLNRTLLLKSQCSQLILRANNEAILLHDMSQLMVSTGGFSMSWAGVVNTNTDAISCQLVAQAGTDSPKYFDMFLKGIESQQKKFLDLLRKGCFFAKYQCKEEVGDIFFDDVYLENDHRFIFFPLGMVDCPFGFFALYMQDGYSFSQVEFDLFSSIMDNLNYAIYNLQGSKEREVLEETLLKVAAGMSESIGDDFFKKLVYILHESFSAQAKIIFQFDHQLIPNKMAAIVKDEYCKDINFKVNDLISKNLVKKEMLLIRDHKGFDFFISQDVEPLKVKTLLGVRIENDDQPLGYLLLAFDYYVERTDFMFSALKIFAARAATEIKRHEAEKKIKFQASLLDCAKDAIIVRDMNHNITYWNKGAEYLFGWTSAEVLGKEAVVLLSDSKQQSEQAVKKLLVDGTWSGEMIERHRSGHTITTECHWTLIYDDQGQPQCILAIKNDISHRKAAEQEIKQLAFYDHLTLLPNRLLLMNRLKKSLYNHQRSEMYGAVLFIDLDNFKMLNDTLGHDKGDLLLQQVAKRLSDTLRKGDTVARLGGDEFVVLVENLKKDYRAAAYKARRIGEKVLKAFALPFYLDNDAEEHTEKNQAHFSSPSIGIALFGKQDMLLDDVLKHADLAMYQAKAAGRNTMQFFDPRMQKQVNDRAVLEAQLREAVTEKSFVLYYQPQVDRKQRIIGVEALLRWQHQEHGIVYPADFIPLAEESGLILPLGLWVLEQACQQLSLWKKNHHTRQLTISVNVSARQFHHRDFVDMVLSVVQQADIDPTRLKLELTESILVSDMALMIERMNKLKEYGVCFSLDDFGTGYSSLLYLKQMPIDELKIDKSFVQDVFGDENDAAIVKTILALGHSLGLSVIAEGVESEEQQLFLMTHQCQLFQGYLYGKPMTIDRLECLLGLTVVQENECRCFK